MRGTRFNDINDITIQVQQHKAYQMHKQRLEKIGNGQYLSLAQALAASGVGNGTTTNQMLLRSSLQKMQNPSKLGGNTYSPHESPRLKQGAHGRHTSLDMNNNNQASKIMLLESSRARNNHSELENKYMTSRIQTIEHKENEKLREIQHENELLLYKLIQIQKGAQLSVPPHLLNSSSRLLQKSTSNFNNSNVVTQETLQSPRQNNKQSQKKLRTLNMVQKKMEAQRIDQANLFLLNKITSVSASIDKKKMESDWNQQRAYRQMIQRAGRKADLNELVTKRQDYLERNFAILPKINYRKENSQESLKEKKNEFSGETFANPQVETNNDQLIMESPRMPQIKIKPQKQKFKQNSLRVSQEPAINNNNFEGVKTSATINHAQIMLSTEPRKPNQLIDRDQPELHLNLSAVNAFDVYKKNKNLISSARKKNIDSKQDLHTANSVVKTTEANLSDSQKLAFEEKTLQNLIKEVETHGILKKRGHGQRTKSDNRITENYEQDNKSTSSIVRIDTENIQVFPIPNQSLTKQLKIGTVPIGRTVVHSPDHSPQITQQFDRSSNTTLVPILKQNGSTTMMGQNGQQSLSKLSQSMRYQQIMSSPRQHATIKKITSKLVNSFSKSRYSYYINKNSGQFKLGMSPSNILEVDQVPVRGESIMSQTNIGEETYRAESQLQMLPTNKLLDSQIRESINKSALERLTTIPINLKRELLMPSSNILAALHLGQRKQKKKKPFNMTGRVIAKPMQQENQQLDQIGLPKIAQRSFDIKSKAIQQQSEEQQLIIEEDPAMIMTPSLDEHQQEQL